MITFKTSELDHGIWSARAIQEAKAIFSKPSTARGRTYEQILQACLRGQAAETWLLSKGYTNDDRPFHDVIDPKGEPIEVKVTEGDYYVRYVLDRYEARLLQGWGDLSKTVYIFLNEEDSDQYTFHGIFKWSGKAFVGYRPNLVESAE